MRYIATLTQPGQAFLGRNAVRADGFGFVAGLPAGLAYVMTAGGTQYVTSAGNRVTVSMTGPLLPINTVLPVITGLAQVGKTLSCSTGTWVNATSNFLYQWLRGGVPISGATLALYTTVSADLTFALSCTVTSINTATTAGVPATSAATAAIIATQPDLAMGFASNTYGSFGTTMALSALPGYSFTRTGAKGRANAAGSAIAYAAANTPLILSGNGYWSEYSATNLLANPQTIGGTGWTTTNATPTSGQTAPDGTATAQQLTATTGSALSSASASNVATTAAASTAHNVTVWVKPGTAPINTIVVTDNTPLTPTSMLLTFNTATGVVGTPTNLATGAAFAATSGKIGTPVNGYYPCTFNLTTNATGTTLTASVGLADAQNAQGCTTGRTMSFWQASLMVGAYNGDIITGAVGMDVMKVSLAKPTGPFVMYGKVLQTSVLTPNKLACFWSDGTTGNVLGAYFGGAGALSIFVLVGNNAVAVTGESGTPVLPRTVTFALRWNGTTYRAFLNGTALGSESAASSIPPGTQFDVGQGVSTLPLSDALASVNVIQGTYSDAQVATLVNAL